MGQDHDIQILEKKIEKAKRQEDKQGHIRELLKLDSQNKLAKAHDRGGPYWMGPSEPRFPKFKKPV